MIPKVVEAHHVRDFILHIRFDDGLEGQVDLQGELWGPIFEPIRSPDKFKQFSIHPELDTIVWPNGADFAPEFLYDAVK